MRNVLLRNGNEIICETGAGFLFVFKACPVLDTGARQQARSTGA